MIETKGSLQINGIFPHLTARAGLKPQRSETGIGALMPWAGKLWYVSYVSSGPGSGSGTGLFAIDDDLRIERHPESVVGTYANRMVHPESLQLFIGPHVIDAEGQVRTIRAIQDYRLTATMPHLFDRENMVYVLGMEGHFWEVNVHTLEATLIANLTEVLEIPEGAQPHFKGGYTAQGRVVVANNTYDERDFAGEWQTGRLAEWDGDQWRILERTGFNEVMARGNWDQVIFATGWDRASAILKVCIGGVWQTYRLPKASHTWEHFWQTEWPRIREVESERYLMDASGMFYELSPVPFGGRVWGIRPIASHLRIIPDFCSWRGLLVLAGNQVTPIFDHNLQAGDPQANLWFGKTDDLWHFGPRKGWGGPWWKTPVRAGELSDPFLMTGFEHKVIHLAHDADHPVRFQLEVDFLGDGSWAMYKTFDVPPRGYVPHVFPEGFSAHWLRVAVDRDCVATAYLHYT